MSTLFTPTLLLAALLSFSLYLLSINPITKLAFLILLFLCSASLFLDLGLPFLGLSYLIVYVGAIAILFLFVIMMIPTFSSNTSRPFPFSYSSFALSFLSLYLSIIFLLLNPLPQLSFFYTPLILNTDWTTLLTLYNDLESFGFHLFLAHSPSIILLAYLLWIVLIGVLSIPSF